MDYELGFKPAEKMLTFKDKCELLVDQFMASDDQCIATDARTASKAKEIRRNVLAYASENYDGLSCRTSGTTVELAKVR